MSSLISQPTPIHGSISENLILPDENRSDFDSLLNGLLDDYQPETKQHSIFVEQLAVAHWLFWRRQRASNAVESRVYENFSDPANWIDPEYRRLFLIERYKTAAERSLKRALQNAESIRKGRRAERAHVEHQAEQALRQARHNLREQKHRAAAVRTESFSAPPNQPTRSTGKHVPPPTAAKNAPPIPFRKNRLPFAS